MKNKILLIIVIICFIIIASVFTSILWYKIQINAPKRNDEKDIIIEIENGTSTINILKLLKENNIIKNELAAKIYLKINKIDSLKAGKYEFSSSKSLKEVVDKISSGDVVTQSINITFLEGKNIR